MREEFNHDSERPDAPLAGTSSVTRVTSAPETGKVQRRRHAKYASADDDDAMGSR